MTASPAPTDPYASLRVPDFRRFIGFLAAQTLATMMQTVAVGWQVYLVTHDPFALGLVGLAEALPFIAFALPAGHLADRVDRRRLSLAGLSVLVLCSATLFTVTRLSLVRPGTAWIIYAVIFLSGIARSYLQPTRTALSADLVPRELYANSITWRSSVWQSAAVVGPALGGIAVAIGGPAFAYGMAALLLIAAWMALFRVGPHPHPHGNVPAATVGEFLMGVRFLLTQPVLLGAQLLDLFSVLFAGAEALLPIFATDLLHVGATGLGILRAAPAAGSVLMSVYQAYRPLVRRMGRVMLISVTFYGLCISAFGVSRSFALSVALLVLSGVFDNVSVVLRSTLLQTLTPRQLLGRVAAVNAIFIGSSNEIGGFESGVAARLLGVVPAVVLGGFVPIVAVTSIAFLIPQLRRLDRIADHEPAGQPS
ncbi:MAG TPA: MFS transporter [Gemmatimonadales bacterium]|jgi:MFS family permease|nr:MFS transporter [Gemmatimonadales bacterium]